MGPESKKYVPLTTLYSYGVANLPPKAATRLLQTYTKEGQSNVEVYDFVSNSLSDLFRGVKVTGPPTKGKTWAPIAEIHRPKLDGCVASLEQTVTKSHDYSITVKVFGIGGGYDKSREFGTLDSFEASGECLQIVVPVTTKSEPCESDGEKFIRVSIEDIGDDAHSVELSGPADGCGLTQDQTSKLGWKVKDVPVPKKTTQEVGVSVQAGQGAEISLDLKVGNLEIGPKATLKLVRETKYSYKLLGPHEYFGYLPKNKIAYNWTVLR